MKNESHAVKTSPFYIAVAGIFMLMICWSWLSEGMFLDGTIYAILSRNLAFGLGSFWQLHWSDTLMPAFVEHPALAIGLESILFRVFGDSRFVERFYSLLTIVLTGIIIVSIWKSTLKKSSTGWLPLLFWISMPTVSWAAVNNMLENTLVIFLCLSVLFYIKSLHSRRIANLILAGSMLSLGFLTKGFVTFTPLSLPFFIWLFTRKNKFFSMVADTMIMLISAIIPLLLLYLFTGANEFFPEYIGIAFSKITENVLIDSRFYILEKLVMELLPALGIIFVILFLSRKKRLSFSQMSSSLRPASTFFVLGFAGVLPILLTMDQSTYFLLTSFPFFAISLGFTVNPLVEPFIERIDFNSKGYRIFKYSGITALSAGIILSVIFSGSFNRDRVKLEDMKAILPELKENSTINILPEMYQDWPLHAYYARYKNISLDRDLNNRHDYLLITTSLYSDTINRQFNRVDLETGEYLLFRRKTQDAGKSKD